MPCHLRGSHYTKKFQNATSAAAKIATGSYSPSPRPLVFAMRSPPPVHQTIYTKAEAKISDTIVITLMRMFMEGPAVSLKGSPTVSPTTAALWASEPLPP